MQPQGDYNWKVTLDDGLVINQVDEEGRKYAYEDLPHARIRLFELHDQGVVGLRMTFQPGEQLIWRRRVQMQPGNQVTEVCHIVGKKVGSLTGVVGFFESDGRVEAVQEFLPNSRWFYPPEFFEFEK